MQESDHDPNTPGGKGQVDMGDERLHRPIVTEG